MCFCGAEEIIGILKQVIRKAISIAQTDYKNENCPPPRWYQCLPGQKAILCKVTGDLVSVCKTRIQEVEQTAHWTCLVTQQVEGMTETFPL